MSYLQATVSEIGTCENLHIVRFSIHDTTLSMMSLELDERIKVGTKVLLGINPSHVAIAKNFQGEISYSNQLPCTIKSCDNGELLCSVSLEFFDNTIESIITQNSASRMNLKLGDEVIAFIKASELSISEIIDE